MKKVIVVVLCSILLSGCVKIEQTPTLFIQPPTTTPTITQTIIPTATPTITATSIPPCNDQEIGDINAPGVPEFAVRMDRPGGGFLDYNDTDFCVYQQTLHGRLVTVAVKKDYGTIDCGGNTTYADYVFDTWMNFWNVFGGFPFKSYSVLIGQDLPFLKEEATYAYGLGFETEQADFTTIAHEIFHAWVGASFGLANGEHWFVEGLAEYYAFRQSDPDVVNLYDSQTTYFTNMNDHQDQYSSNTNYPLYLIRYDNLENPKYDLQQYQKGVMVAYLLDIELKKTGHSLDDVVRILYQRYGISQEEHMEVTDDQIMKILNEVSGNDFTDFFRKYVYSKEELPLPYHKFVWVCHDEQPAIIPTQMPLTEKDLKFSIDGNSDDWAGYTPILTDPVGDADNPEYGDFKEVYSAQDDNFLYFLIDAGKQPIGKQWGLEFYFDTRSVGACLPADTGMFIYTDDLTRFISWDLEQCGADRSGKDQAGRGFFKWEEYIEMAVPRYIFKNPENIKLEGITISIERDATSWWMNSDLIKTSEFSMEDSPQPTPLPGSSLTPELPIIFNGKSDDWKSYSPILTDEANDSADGANTDLIAAFQVIDSGFLYLFIQTKEPIISTESELDIWLDINNVDSCDTADIGISVHPNNNTVWSWDYSNCQVGANGAEIPKSIVAWKNGVEILIPLNAFGNPEYVTITHVSFNVAKEGIWHSADEIVK